MNDIYEDFPQVIDQSNPVMLMVPVTRYRKLLTWTDTYEWRFRMVPQSILGLTGHETHKVMLEDDYLLLAGAQVPEEQHFVLDIGDDKGADARALFMPHDGSMWVLKDSIMAENEAEKDFAEYSAERTTLRAPGGGVKRELGKLVFTRHVNFSAPSRAASVLVGYRVGARSTGWINPYRRKRGEAARIKDLFSKWEEV